MVSRDHDRARTIRAARQADLSAVLDLYRHLNIDDPLLDRDHAEVIWSDMLVRAGIHILLAELRGQVIATCTLIIIPNLTRNGCSYALIENVVTHGDFRGRGHGRAILRAALDKAWEADCYKVELLTGRKDDAIHSIYEGAGFRSDVKIGFYAARNPWY